MELLCSLLLSTFVRRASIWWVIGLDDVLRLDGAAKHRSVNVSESDRFLCTAALIALRYVNQHECVKVCVKFGLFESACL